MKYRRRNYRNRRKRVARRNRRKNIRNRTMVTAGLGFPKKMLMTHKYIDFVTLACTSGAYNKYQFSCNGLYDPNITGAGHQPMYFDNMTAIYDHYTVIGSKLTVKTSCANTSIGPAAFGIYIDDDTVFNATSLQALAEQSSGSFKVIPAGSNNTFSMTKKWSAKKYFGGSVLGNDNLQGTSTGNPSEQSFYTIGFVTNDSSTATLFLQVEIEYIAVWDELKDQASN